MSSEAMEAGLNSVLLQPTGDPEVGLSRPHKSLSYLPHLPPVDIEFADLTYSVPQGKRGNKIILRGVNGVFRSGQLTAILGPSGAGKSTLLNVLAGYKCFDATGSITVNGRPRNLRQFRRISRYIMQEDMIQPHLTVQEAMMVAADLKLGNKLTRKQKIKSVLEILDMLRLEGGRHTQTTRLSGGERKRLSVALEMINNPPVIFLDEPTTGLDELSSVQCVRLLQSLAKDGRTVVCSIHTPSASLFQLFDQVYVVAQGQCVYQGTGNAMVPFLNTVGLPCPTHYNPADFVIEVSSGEYGDHQEKLVAAVENERHNQMALARVPQPADDLDVTKTADTTTQNSRGMDMLAATAGKDYEFSTSPWMQFRILLCRMLLQTWRDFDYLLLRFTMNIFLAIIVGGLFFNFGQDGSKTIFNFGFIYTCIIVFLYLPMLPVLLYFPQQVQLLKREYFNRWYSLNSYFWAMTLSGLPSQLFFGTMYLCMVYVMTDQPLEMVRVIQFFTVCTLISFTSESLGHAISATLNVVNAMFIGPCLSVPLILLAVYGMGYGSFNIPIYMRIIMSLSYLRYGLEGLVVAIYENRTILPCPPEEDYCPYRDPKYLLRELGMEGANIYVSVAALTLFFFVFKATCYFLLRIRLTSSRSFPALNVVLRFVKSHLNLTHNH